MTCAALEAAFLKAPLARRNSSQSHPVFADGTHRPLNDGNRTKHRPSPERDDRYVDKLWSVRWATLGQNLSCRSRGARGEPSTERWFVLSGPRRRAGPWPAPAPPSSCPRPAAAARPPAPPLHTPHKPIPNTPPC